MILSWFLLLGATLSYSKADYPPHDLSYRVHYHDLYPKEVPDSTLCQGRANGAYPHRNLDLGDPRCTFVVCSNSRPIIQSCPRGTRTAYNLEHQFLSPHLTKHRPIPGNHLYPPTYPNPKEETDRTEEEDRVVLGDSESDVAGEAHANQVNKPPDNTFGYNINIYSPLYFHHKMCNIHDVNGVCGNPFPDLNAYSNEIPTIQPTE